MNYLKDRYSYIKWNGGPVPALPKLLLEEQAIIQFSNSDKKYNLKESVFERMKGGEKHDLIIRDEIRNVKGYQIIFQFLDEERLKEGIFALESFQDYLGKKKIGFNQIGLTTWFNFLKRINLIQYNIQTKQVVVNTADKIAEENDFSVEGDENPETASPNNQKRNNNSNPIAPVKRPQPQYGTAVFCLQGGTLMDDRTWQIQNIQDFDDFKEKLEAILPIMRRKLERKLKVDKNESAPGE